MTIMDPKSFNVTYLYLIQVDKHLKHGLLAFAQVSSCSGYFEIKTKT